MAAIAHALRLAPALSVGRSLEDNRTLALLGSWTRRPGRLLGPWAARAALAALGLLSTVLVLALTGSRSAVVPPETAPFVAGRLSDVASILRSNLLVLALHASTCVLGFVVACRLPARARLSGRLAIAFAAGATACSMWVQASANGRSLAGVAAFDRVSPAVLLLGVLPHAVPELIALFLPLAAWMSSSRRGQRDQLLAAATLTVLVAVPLLVAAALLEVYVSPHVFNALTHIYPPHLRHA